MEDRGRNQGKDVRALPTIIKDDIPSKEREPGSFTLPCTINNMHFNKALANLGASVKLHGVPVTAFSEDGLSAIATKLGSGETKNLKKTSQTPKGIPVGQKIGFKPTKQVYQPVSKKSIADISENKKNNVDPTKKPRDNSSGYSFWNVNSSSPSTTLIIEKIDKIEKLIIDGKVTLVDDEGKPLEKVDYLGNYDSEDEVASVDNEMASFFAKKDGYGTQSLLEQWKESYKNDDSEYDPYDYDMYESQEILEKLQAFCDNLDIRVRRHMPEDPKTPLILGRPFLYTAQAKIDVFKIKFALRVGNEKLVYKSNNPTNHIVMKVYALGLRERMELDLEARLMGEALFLNRSRDLKFGDYIELNDLNEPLELRNHENEDLGPAINE
ncbi:hypothetical protein Tco_0578634 [Tanacetum coccineum]